MFSFLLNLCERIFMLRTMTTSFDILLLALHFYFYPLEGRFFLFSFFFFFSVKITGNFFLYCLNLYSSGPTEFKGKLRQVVFLALWIWYVSGVYWVNFSFLVCRHQFFD